MNTYPQRFKEPWRRFAEKVERRPSGCWEWTGARQTGGYGVLGVGSSKLVRAHRFAWELHYGEVPEGLSVLHRCDNPCCVNTEHLFLGTQADNMHDMRAKGRGRKH